MAIVVLLLTRELHLDSATVGVVFAGLGVGGLIGAALAWPARRAFGMGPTILVCVGFWAVGYGRLAFIPESGFSAALAAILLGAVGAINPIAGANVAIRQYVTPHPLPGRVIAVVTVGTAIAISVGAFAGGVIADSVGIRPTLLLGGILPLLGLGWVLLSPVRRLKTLEALEA